VLAAVHFAVILVAALVDPAVAVAAFLDASLDRGGEHGAERRDLVGHEVLGFTIAGGVEAWVPKAEIAGLLDGEGPRDIVLGSFFGFVSSSCSFSAIATAKNLFKKNASAAAALGATIGVITFVCSVGNVPFAAILWNNGLPFGSVLSYIYADLIVPR